MSDAQYFWLMVTLAMNGAAIICLGLAQHFNTKAIQAMTTGLMQVIQLDQIIVAELTAIREGEKS